MNLTASAYQPSTDTNLFAAQDFRGRPLMVPDQVIDGSDPYLNLMPEELAPYYQTHGYVVARNVIPAAQCERAMQAFNALVKPYDGHLYRQPSGGKPETHRFSAEGFMLNSILNPHDLNSGRFGQFRRAALEIFSSPEIQQVLHRLFGEAGVLVQSMYFEGNPQTWPHQDTYYLDSEHLGGMTATWIALEDIKPGAGRFYVCPGSHRIDMKKNGGDFDVAFNHARYKALAASLIEERELQIHAPALRRGDILFWNSRTLHGSLPTTTPQYSRSSFTAHYIPRSHRFMQFQSRVKSFRNEEWNQVGINHPKDQDLLANRLVLGLEAQFPRSFQAMKNLAIKVVTR
jgi:phytanoyl-CoA hydroxylase